MSVGKLNSYVDKGSNFPWQFKMLNGLQDIINAITGATLGQSRTVGIERPSTISGSITQQVFSISFANTGSQDALVNGVTLKPGETINFDAGGVNNYFPAGYFSYSTNTVGAELLITYIY